MDSFITRFAPSPTGYLHRGHGFAAWFAAMAAGPAGIFRLRIEDLDQSRARPAFEAAIFEDLAWLGLRWAEPVIRQSERGAAYAAALDRLRAQGVVYPCFCSRRSLAQAAPAAPPIDEELGAPHAAGPLYPGTCRRIAPEVAALRVAAGEAHAWRLNVEAGLALTGPLMAWDDGALTGSALPQPVDPRAGGDIVIARKDAPAAYHLAVVVDDAAEGVTLVTRAIDLWQAVPVQRLLQALLGLPAPRYRHHPLLMTAQGLRLSKREPTETLRALRAAGTSPQALRAGLPPPVGTAIDEPHPPLDQNTAIGTDKG